jgi:Ca2+-binding EF-hand superfamily protein
MGNEASKQLSQDELNELTKSTKFTQEEIHYLWNKYQKLSQGKKKDSLIDIKELQLALGLKSEKLTKYVFKAFDSDSSQAIDFVEYVKGLNALSSTQQLKKKLLFVF